MKFQFSLRTLIIGCFVASIGLYFVVQVYVRHARETEFNRRCAIIAAIAENRINSRINFFRSKPNCIGSGANVSQQASGDSWEYSSRSSISFNSGETQVTRFRVTCKIQDDKIGSFIFDCPNGEPVDLLESELISFCDKNRWRHEIRYVEKVDK